MTSGIFKNLIKNCIVWIEFIMFMRAVYVYLGLLCISEIYDWVKESSLKGFEKIINNRWQLIVLLLQK